MLRRRTFNSVQCGKLTLTCYTKRWHNPKKIQSKSFKDFIKEGIPCDLSLNQALPQRMQNTAVTVDMVRWHTKLNRNETLNSALVFLLANQISGYRGFYRIKHNPFLSSPSKPQGSNRQRVKSINYSKTSKAAAGPRIRRAGRQDTGPIL